MVRPDDFSPPPSLRWKRIRRRSAFLVKRFPISTFSAEFFHPQKNNTTTSLTVPVLLRSFPLVLFSTRTRNTKRTVQTAERPPLLRCIIPDAIRPIPCQISISSRDYGWVRTTPSARIHVQEAAKNAGGGRGSVARSLDGTGSGL